jgi:hypothetical protein
MAISRTSLTAGASSTARQCRASGEKLVRSTTAAAVLLGLTALSAAFLHVCE